MSNKLEPMPLAIGKVDLLALQLNDVPRADGPLAVVEAKAKR